jgi:hypothetical protein
MIDSMRNFLIGRAFSRPALALGSAVLWGLVEFIALQRLRLANPGARRDKRLAH